MSDVHTARQNYDKAVALHRQGELAQAERHYEAVREVFPDHPGVLHGLGLIRLAAQRFDEAQQFLARAAALAPKDGAIRCDLGRACLMLGRHGAAVDAFEAALALMPGDAAALNGLGDALSIMGRLDEARTAFETLRAHEPAAAHFGLGNIAAQQGRFDAARGEFEHAVALAPRQPAYHRALAESARFVEGDARLAALEALARDEAGFTEAQKVELHFALAKAYDDLKRFGDAFAHLAQGNAIKRRLVPYDEAAVAAFVHEIMFACAPEVLTGRWGAGHPSDLPVFVVGMPRSGTSLVEQMLASHPQVFGAGELTAVNDLIAEGADYPHRLPSEGGIRRLGEEYVKRVAPLAPGAGRIVDKLPANFRHLGLIHLALPNARIVHVRRDAMDTCFSCYSKLFLGGLNYTYELGELGRYYKLHDKLMAHWRAVLPPGAMLEVQYETLVRDFENEARRVLAFCGLAWDARCLSFHETKRAVRTLSQAQVRQPLYAGSIGRWRDYEPWLGPLVEALQ